MGRLGKAFAVGRGGTPTPACKFQLDEGRGTHRYFALVRPTALWGSTSCSCRVLPDRRCSAHFALLTEFSPSTWAPRLNRHDPFPLWLAFWLQCTDRSGRSSFTGAQFCAFSWDLGSKEAEAGWFVLTKWLGEQYFLTLQVLLVQDACLFVPDGWEVDVLNDMKNHGLTEEE